MAPTATTKNSILDSSKVVESEPSSSSNKKREKEIASNLMEEVVVAGAAEEKKESSSKENNKIKKKMADKNKKLSKNKKIKKSSSNKKINPKGDQQDEDDGDGDGELQQDKDLKKPRSLVEELKLFQNNQLLNQQDPMELLQRQLNELMENESSNNNKKTKISSSKTNGLSKDRYDQYDMKQQNTPGFSASNQLELTATSGSNNNNTSGTTILPFSSNHINSIDSGGENMSTLKKGVLWQQQQYDKFHQRLFCRWKKRYFILTTDYLVCFKRSSSKVGHSEMGKFLYKTSLNDITKVDWLKPNKSDKGAIILQIIGNFNLFLWSKENLAEWMFMLRESIDRYKIRKSCVVQNSKSKTISNLDIPLQQKPSILGANHHHEQNNELDNNNEIYENTANSLSYNHGNNIQSTNDNQQEFTGINKNEQKPFNYLNGSLEQKESRQEIMTGNYDNNSSKDQHQDNQLSSPEDRLSRSHNNKSNKIEKENSNNNTFNSPRRRNKTAQYNSNSEITMKTSSAESDKVNEDQEEANRKKDTSLECHEVDVRGTGKGVFESTSSDKMTINHESSDNDTKSTTNSKRNLRANSTTASNQSSANGGNSSSRSRKSKTSRDTKVSGGSLDDDNSLCSIERLQNQKVIKGKRDDASNGNLSSDHVTAPSVNGNGESSSSSSRSISVSSSSPTTITKSTPSSSSKDSKASTKNNNSDNSSLMREKNLVKEVKQKSFKRNKEERNEGNRNGQIITRKDSSLNSEKLNLVGEKTRPREEKENQQRSETNGTSNSGTNGNCQDDNDDNKPATITSSSFDDNRKGSIKDKTHKNFKGSGKENRFNEGQPQKEESETQRPMTNMIRRDDSWQSLVSLTRVGKATPMMPMMQGVAQRSLYAQHIMPNGAVVGREEANLVRQFGGATNKQIISLIESTATPSRNPLFRNRSVQAPRSSRAPLLGSQQHQQHHVQTASFDMAACPSNSSKLQQEQAIAGLSYQQKLLQLQLMHNSNNVDYIRHNGMGAEGDYTIYGPESTTTTNHYGYSSMRSNLKSAASEFSFIRPSPSSYVQSTLPHKPKQRQDLVEQHNNNNMENNNNKQLLQQSIRSSLILPKTTSPAFKKQYDDNNNDLSYLSPTQQQQYLVNPVTGERLMQQQLLQQQFNDTGFTRTDILLGLQNGSELPAPMRELPLKPNKKRNNNNLNLNDSTTNGVPKSSSLTSSIACFFKRAFSRRSKRNSSSKRKNPKLNESCSSSIGALGGDVYTNVIPVVPSAFSTGSKSVGGGGGENSNQKQQQSQRMIDMIETFTNKTSEGFNINSAGVASKQAALQNEVNRNQYQYHHLMLNANNNNNLREGVSDVPQQTPRQLSVRAGTINRFGSPLHKSNSISTTMGFSHFVEQQGSPSSSRGHQFLYDNNNELSRAEILAAGGSPMMLRSSKVMSANLTPTNSINIQQSSQAGAHNNILSPRISASRQHEMGLLPRPSSIYGQPSMISSPMLTRDHIDHRNINSSNNFALHRNSLHNAHFRDINRLNHPFGKAPILDTTREVAEELASPVNGDHKQLVTGEEEDDLRRSTAAQQVYLASLQSPHQKQAPNSGSGRYIIKRDNFDNVITSSPSSGRLQQQFHPRQIGVLDHNSILQSPTMDTIYDNHPMMLNSATSTDLQAQIGGYSHYDNHNQLIMEQQHGQNQYQHSPMISRSRLGSNSMTQFLPSSPMVHSNADSYQQQQQQHHYKSELISTPSRSKQIDTSETLGQSAQQNLEWFNENQQKPSAIVAPNSNQFNSPILNDSNSRISSGIRISRGNLPLPPTPTAGSGLVREQNLNVLGAHQSSNVNSRSPLMSRRTNNTNTNYQQSPLVSQQTRVLNKRDGLIQATVIGNCSSSSVRLSGDSRFSNEDQIRKSGHHEDENCVTQAVINIAGAPGINLEPSLAASLLRGTNINAYESSTFNRLSGNSQTNKSQTNAKTFLVSTRMSKSMAYSQNNNDATSTDDGLIINSSMHKDDINSIKTINTNASGINRTSSSYVGDVEKFSRSINSNENRKSKTTVNNSSQEEALEHDEIGNNGLEHGESVGSKRRSKNTHSNSNEKSFKLNKSKQTTNTSGKQQHYHFNRESVKEGSSDEPSDEISSSNTGSLDKLEERNWITSKLVNNHDD